MRLRLRRGQMRTPQRSAGRWRLQMAPARHGRLAFQGDMSLTQATPSPPHSLSPGKAPRAPAQQRARRRSRRARPNDSPQCAPAQLPARATPRSAAPSPTEPRRAASTPSHSAHQRSRARAAGASARTPTAHRCTLAPRRLAHRRARARPSCAERQAHQARTALSASRADHQEHDAERERVRLIHSFEPLAPRRHPRSRSLIKASMRFAAQPAPARRGAERGWPCATRWCAGRRAAWSDVAAERVQRGGVRQHQRAGGRPRQHALPAAARRRRRPLINVFKRRRAQRPSLRRCSKVVRSGAERVRSLLRRQQALHAAQRGRSQARPCTVAPPPRAGE